MKKQKTATGNLLILGGSFLGLVVLAAFVNPLRIIDSAERAVLVSGGKASESPLDAGLHFILPGWQRVEIYNIRVQKFSVPVQSSTRDLQQLNGTITVNYRILGDEVVDFYVNQGTLDDVVDRIIGPQTQEAFKAASAQFTAEQSITQRINLKEQFDESLGTRLAPYHLTLIDTAIEDLDFSEQFASAVEAKQVADQEAKRAAFDAAKAEQEALAQVNRARGEAEAQRLLQQSLTPEIIQLRAIEAWQKGGSLMPVYMGSENLPFIQIPPPTRPQP